MPILTVLPLNKAVEVEAGTTLLQALMSVGIQTPHKCDGKAICGTCHLFVHDGRKTLARIQKHENEKLDTLVGVSSKSRLACQAVMGSENVTIEMLGFSSGF
jgi:2Fe-2S ferredoxin